jgi:hypothetical protein
MPLSMEMVEIAILGGLTGLIVMVGSLGVGIIGAFLYYAFRW